MPTIEVEVFINQELSAQMEKLADAKRVSRDQLFAVALEEFIKHHKDSQPAQQDSDRDEPNKR